MVSSVRQAIDLFVATNIDDNFAISLTFSAPDSGGPRVKNVGPRLGDLPSPQYQPGPGLTSFTT